MKRKYFLVVLFLILAIFLAGCGGTVIPSTNITGNWTMTNIVTATNNPIHNIGATTTAKCNIVDSSGSLTIYNFDIVNQEVINWNTGYGIFSKPNLTVNISGSYLNIYYQTVSNIIYFEGTLDAIGISGSGTWTQTISVSGYTWVSSGTTIFIKG
ncbi:hypothetical protein ES695_05260 [Candidatus Atribacteria bacterium 1244-E10-H5-B2]|nr:MAG: hypothetical protein ES695_05260 [Candidatus Atribacteria bacterium 1244-E10-H5-B2]